MAHEFTAREAFGTRYSTLGKRVATSMPSEECDKRRTNIAEMNVFQLCDHLGVELEDPEAELAYLIENRKQYYQNHSYMEKYSKGTAHDGPVFVGDTVYRHSNGEKYTVQEDGSLKSAAGKIITSPQWGGFIHYPPKQGEKGALLPMGNKNCKGNPKAAAKRAVRKQSNPLVEGEAKTRTPEEAAKSAAVEREHARKAAAKAALAEMSRAEKEEIISRHVEAAAAAEACAQTCPEDTPKECPLWKALDEIPVAKFLKEVPDKDLGEEILRRNIVFTSLDGFTDKEVAEELRRRGYDVTATKTVQL